MSRALLASISKRSPTVNDLPASGPFFFAASARSIREQGQKLGPCMEPARERRLRCRPFHGCHLMHEASGDPEENRVARAGVGDFAEDVGGVPFAQLKDAPVITLRA